MADFLTVVSSKKTRDAEPLVREVKGLEIQDAVHIVSADSALKALKNQPGRGAVNNVLKYLTTDGFSLLLPEPLNASIAHQLVNDTIPNYWRSLKDSTQGKLLAQVLRNPIGLGHTSTRLRTLIADSRQKKSPGETRNTLEHVEDLLDVFNLVLYNDNTSNLILQDVLASSKNVVQQKLIWKEYLAQTASGRILSLAAEAEDVLKKRDISRDGSWVADGNQFAAWLGRNIAIMISARDEGEECRSAVVELLSKALGLGYTERVVSSLISPLIDNDSIGTFTDLLSRMKSFEQRKYFNAVIAAVIKQHFASDIIRKDNAPILTSKLVSGAASLLYIISKENDILKEHLVSSLTRSTLPPLDDSLASRRSVIASLAKDENALQTLLENSIKLFGDSVYVKHTPVLQQEVLAQNLALCCGYVQRSQPMFLTLMAKSTYHVNGMSNRIGTPSARARFLGIAVGVAISKLTDKPDLQLVFELEGNEAEEASWYQRLTEVDDEVGSIKDLQTQTTSVTSNKSTHSRTTLASKPSKVPAVTEIQGPRIVEILSESEDEDDDLVPYQKPDSDPEDDGDDPETINRNKPTAPVYIRDLITALRDQENYDRHELGLSTAASLIRRKANFGTEVIDHLEELATILTGLQDNLELDNFAQQRQQALIAVLLAKPALMAQWFARSFFSGDYSLTQRIAMLTTLGLGARELAGVKDSTTEELIPAQPCFPSKQLPPHLHKLYADDKATVSVAKISSRMAREMLSPIASQAADQLSGPNILKMRTFSSRMEVEKNRQKPIPNALAQIVAENFFFPLTGRWWLQIRANNDSIHTSTHLLPPFLQTVSLLLNASGPNTLALPQMTREYWELLLSVRGLAINDKNILNAVLFGFLMILETNENKERLATEQGKELMETQAWVKTVFEGMGAGSDEDERVRVLAAGVVVRCQEVVEKYQRRMVGALMDY
ncbi:Nn.00g055320.m01.CDS01 [Neocucurbitaria sp. VM-36]